MDPGFATITKSELNSLVKEIEFYKMQSGEYPRNLHQLEKDGANGGTMIYDPMATRKMTSGSKSFHYHRIGDKYTLYSVGADGIANTKDDIYPNLKINDTSKCGLVIHRDIQ